MHSPDNLTGGAVPGGSVATSSEPGPIGKLRAWLGGAGGGALPPSPPHEGDEEEDDGMMRMSFLEHLQELRSRLIKCIIGLCVAFGVSLFLSNPLWDIVSQPAVQALRNLGINPPHLHQIEPMEGITIIWFKLPLIVGIFLASPWVLYQVWAFISPGLYRRERRFAAPFILCSAGLFITGGVFAYYVVFRFAIEFLLGIGIGHNVDTTVSMNSYFNIFCNVVLGVSVVFEIPVLLFFLTLLRIVSPTFLLRNSRYAVLVIFLLAAVVTPTPDAFNLMLFAIPMCLLFFVGVFASHLLVLKREGRGFPWRTSITIVIGVLLLIAAVTYVSITHFGYKVVPHWPFLVR
jgi:sec-independent protein translocase protein TatC